MDGLIDAGLMLMGVGSLGDRDATWGRLLEKPRQHPRREAPLTLSTAESLKPPVPPHVLHALRRPC